MNKLLKITIKFVNGVPIYIYALLEFENVEQIYDHVKLLLH